MIILAVETGTSDQSLAVLQDEQVLATSTREGTGSPTGWLIPAIDRVLSSVGMDVADLQGLAVGQGPGSFTGLRVGLATMAAIRLALNLPLVAVFSLEAMAWNARGIPLPLRPMIRARAGEVYWAEFRWDGDTLVRLCPDQVGSVNRVVSGLQEPTLVFGDGWLADRTEDLIQLPLLMEAPPEAMKASAVSVGLASLSRFNNRELAPCGVAPHYVQRSYAEMAGPNRPDSVAR